MREIGIDIQAIKPQLLTPEITRDAELLITMGCDEACPNVPGLRRQDWPLRDPKGLSPGEVRSIRDDVRARVQRLIEEEGWRPPGPSSETVPARP